MLEGIRGELGVSELCQPEGIHPTIYYKWLKDLMEACKGRLRGDTKREATSKEVRQLHKANERAKERGRVQRGPTRTTNSPASSSGGASVGATP